MLKAGKSGYSLIELVVVIAIVTLLAVIGLPNLFNRNDRYLLDNTASKVRQLLIEAQVRSLTPTKSGSTGTAQVYQVAMSNFNTVTTGSTAVGNIGTTTLDLQQGLSQCDGSDAQGGFLTLSTLRLPRGIYISQFFPTNQQPTDKVGVIRFTVGKVGFTCGKDTNPTINSTDFSNTAWQGSNGTSNTYAKYLVIEVSSTNLTEKRYIAIDRLSSEVLQTKTSPQNYFTPLTDNFPPQWSAITPVTASVVTAPDDSGSTVSISFPRAYDYISNTQDDPNLNVYYDISWDYGGSYSPIVLKYFYSLSQSTVTYTFTSTNITTANLGTVIHFKVSSYDEKGQLATNNSGVQTDLTTSATVVTTQ